MAGPPRKHELAWRNAGHVVQGEDRVAGKLLEQAVGHHAQRAAAAFFGRLEDQVQRCRRNGAAWPGARAAASRLAVWPSWPQACMRPGTWLAQGWLPVS